MPSSSDIPAAVENIPKRARVSICYSFLFSTSLAGSLKDRGRLNNNLTGPPCRALSFNSPPGGGAHLVQIAAKLKMPGANIVRGICKYLR